MDVKHGLVDAVISKVRVRLASLLAILLLPLLAGCGSNDLDRSNAKEMIEAHEQLAQLKSDIPSFRGALEEAEAQGVLLDEGLSADVAGEISSWDVRQGVIYVTKPVDIEVEITGVTEPSSSSQNTRQVMFNWRYGELPPMTKRFAASGGNGEATFVKFDDGWRVDRMLVGSNRERVELSANELNAIESAQKEKSAKQEQRQNYIQQSLVSSKVIDTISFPEGGRKVPQSIIVSDADIKYLTASGATDTIWLGQVAEVKQGDERFGNRVELGLRYRMGVRLPGPDDKTVNDRVAKAVRSALDSWRKKYSDLTDKEIQSLSSRGQ